MRKLLVLEETEIEEAISRLGESHRARIEEICGINFNSVKSVFVEEGLISCSVDFTFSESFLNREIKYLSEKDVEDYFKKNFAISLLRIEE